MNIETPAIVVVAFNRLNSLKRLLNSLNNAIYKEEVRLIISIDKGENSDILKFAENFSWQYGQKEVIYQETNLGLKKHIIKCGDLTEKYGSVILLEDDLYVSPYFYDYTKQAISFYKDDDNISQFSLYKHPVNNNTGLKFLPVEDSSDIFFMQFASSWGQAWTNKQWKKFKTWLQSNDLSINENDNLPNFVINWKETSWLKYFIKFNQENNKFVVYPRVSLTTNFSDAGTNNVLNKIYLYQQPLLLEKKEFIFKNIKDSIAIYDTYYELHKFAANKLISEYKDIEFDLYGTKKLHKIKSKYLFSIKNCNYPIKTYDMALKPHEVNILKEIDGVEINLGLTKDFLENEVKNIDKKKFKYYWTHNLRYVDLFYLFVHRSSHKYTNLRNKIKKKLF